MLWDHWDWAIKSSSPPYKHPRNHWINPSSPALFSSTETHISRLKSKHWLFTTMWKNNEQLQTDSLPAILLFNFIKNESVWGLPWWLRGGESACQSGFASWSRRIPHAAGQLNPCTTATELRSRLRSGYWGPCALQPECCRGRGHRDERHRALWQRVAPSHFRWRRPHSVSRPWRSHKYILKN